MFQSFRMIAHARSAVVIAAVLALASCKTMVATDLYTSDLISATEGEQLTAPMVISIELPSESKCKEFASDIADAIRSEMETATHIGCRTEAFNNFADYRVQSEIVTYDGSARLLGRPLAIGVTSVGDDFIVTYLINPEGIKAVWNGLPEELTRFETFDPDLYLSAVLTNDLREPVEVVTDDVFVDGVPVQGTARRLLLRRDQVVIQMSNVTNTAFGSTDNVAHVVTFRIAEVE
ncbi:MAG: hypothetical protein OXH96_06635 [Spirochaetaceae bacterium]|nr:hypothetical protein [Spirochaetaceae bacterium]